jgi:hypothetical protein
VRIQGHAGQILRSYLHDLCDLGIQACYHGGRGLRIKFLLRGLFGCFSAQNHQVAFSTSHESLPMGVKRRVYYLVFATGDVVNLYSCIGANISIFIGCTTSTPDGSSPRGYSQKNLFEYRLRISFFFNLAELPVEYISSPISLRINFSSGVRSALPMGVALKL